MDGEYGKSASLWLADMERHRENGSSPSEYLRNIDRQLEGEADCWAKITPSVRTSILKAYGDEATESDIQAFDEAVTHRFKLTDEEIFATQKSLPHVRFACLWQTPSENLEEYYSRAQDILIALHGCDDDYDTLTPLQISLRSIMVAHFVLGLREDSSTSKGIRLRLYQNHVHEPRVTLHKAFKMVEAESKKMEMEKESRQEGKRKLGIDEESHNAKKQKQMIVKIKLPTSNQHDEASSENENGEEASHSGSDEGAGNVVAVPSKSLPALPNSEPALEAEPSVKGKDSS